MRTVKITKTQTLKRTQSIVISVPPHLNDSEIAIWLFENSEWENDLDMELQTTIADIEPELDEVRYDVYETKRVHTYGGHL